MSPYFEDAYLSFGISSFQANDGNVSAYKSLAPTALPWANPYMSCMTAISLFDQAIIFNVLLPLIALTYDKNILPSLNIRYESYHLHTK